MSEATPTRGVPITLDKERRLRYPLGVLRTIDKGADLATILYLGLKHEDPELTAEKVGEIADLEMLPELAAALKKASGGSIDLYALLGMDQPEAGKANPA